jgi:hypothetical protein
VKRRDKKEGGVVGKAAGDKCIFIPGWQMRAVLTPCRTRAEAKTEESVILVFSAKWSPHTGGNRGPQVSSSWGMHLINRRLIGVYLTDTAVTGGRDGERGGG